MRVANFLQDGDFSIDSVDIRLILDFVFFQYFYSNFIASYNMGSLLNFSKCSFTFCLSYYETTNLFAFAVLFLLGVLPFLAELRRG